MNNFMPSIVKEFEDITKKDYTTDWEDLVWKISSECGWSQEELLSADIPFVLSLARGRTRALKEQEKKFNKKK